MKKNYHKKRAKYVSRFFSIVAANAVGITGAAALVAVPYIAAFSFPIVMTIFVVAAVGGVAIEGTVFWSDVKSGFTRIFGEGPFHIFRSLSKHLANVLLLRELLHARKSGILQITDVLPEYKPNAELEKETRKLKQKFYKKIAKEKLTKKIDLEVNSKVQQSKLLEEIATIAEELQREQLTYRDPRNSNQLKSDIVDYCKTHKEANIKLSRLLHKEAKQRASQSGAQLIQLSNDQAMYLLEEYVQVYYSLPELPEAAKEKIEKDPLKQLNAKILKVILEWQRQINPSADIFDLIRKPTTRKKVLREYALKQTLIPITLFFALATGISFGTLTFNSILFSLSLVGISIAGFGLPALAIIALAAIVAVAFTMFMYTTLANAIEHDLHRRVLKSIKKMYTPNGQFNEFTSAEKTAHVILSGLKLLLLGTFLATTIFITICSAGAYYKSNIAMFTQVATWVNELSKFTSHIADIINIVIIWGGVIPAGIIFIFDHLIETLKKLFTLGGKIAKLSKNAYRAMQLDPWYTLSTAGREVWAFITSPTKVLAAIISVLFFSFFFMHIAGEAAINSNGVQDPSDKFAQTVDFIAEKLSNFLQTTISGPVLAFFATLVDEFFADGDFVIQGDHHCQHGHQHGVSYQKIYTFLSGIGTSATDEKQIDLNSESMSKHHYPLLFEDLTINNTSNEKFAQKPVSFPQPTLLHTF